MGNDAENMADEEKRQALIEEIQGKVEELLLSDRIPESGKVSVINRLLQVLENNS